MKYFITLLVLFTTLNLFSQDKELVNTGKQFIVIDSANFGFEIKGYFDIAFEDNGIVWMLSEGGLVKFDYLSKQYYSINQLLHRSFGGFSCIAIDSKNNKWIGTSRGGLVKFDGEFVYKIGSRSWNKILIDKNDNLFLLKKSSEWAGDPGPAGLYQFTNEGVWIDLEEKSGIEFGELFFQFPPDITVDNSNQLWITNNYCSSTGNLEGWSTYCYLNGFNVLDIANDTLLKKSCQPIFSEDKLTVFHPNFDNSQKLWMITSEGCLCSFYNDKWNFFEIPYDLIVYSFAIDFNNNLWLISTDGLVQFDQTNFRLFKFSIDDIDLNDEADFNIAVDKYSNIIISYQTIYKDIYDRPIDRIALFREGGVLLPEEAVSVMEKQQQKTVKVSISPNPFSQSTIINYELREAGYISLELFDMLGNKIATLVDDWQEAGRHNYELRMTDHELNAGMYMVRMSSGEGVVTEKVVYVE